MEWTIMGAMNECIGIPKKRGAPRGEKHQITTATSVLQDLVISGIVQHKDAVQPYQPKGHSTQTKRQRE